MSALQTFDLPLLQKMLRAPEEPCEVRETVGSIEL
jgi:hypothetical protein